MNQLHVLLSDLSMIQIVLYSTLVVSVLGILVHTIRFLHVYLKYRHIPGYVSYLDQMVGATLAGEMYVDYGYHCTLKAFLNNPKENLVKVQNGTSITFAIAKDHELIKEFLIKKYKTFEKDEKMWKPMALYGHNILSANSLDPIWKKHRTLANPIFSNASHLKNVFRVTLEELPRMIDYLKKYYPVDQEKQSIRNVNITQELKSITLTVINKVAFDYDIQLFDKTPKHSIEMHQSIGHLLSGILYQFILPKWFFDYIPFGIFKQFKEARFRFHDTAMTMVRKKQAEIEKNNQLKDDEDLLSLLLKSFSAQNLSEDEKLSNDELVSAMFIIFFAGFETSSTSLNFMLRLLAIHPEVQEKLIEEIDSNIESVDSLNFEDITEKLLLMNSFIKESMRVKPPVGAIARTVLKKEGETIGKLHLEQNSVLVCNMAVHHQLTHNLAMETFKYDRFYQDPSLDEKIERGTMGHLAMDFSKDNLIPFSLGPRDCLGKRMALLEIKVILVFLLKQFRLKVPDHLKEEQAKIKEGYFMTRTIDSPFILDFEARQ